MRIKFKIIYTLLLLIFSYTSLFANQYEEMIVECVEIVLHSTDSTINKEMVKAKLRTKEKVRFSQNEFDSDLKTLAAEYDRVESHFHQKENKLILTLDIWPKPIIRSIYFNNNNNISTKKLRKELDIESGTPFDRESFTTAFNKLKALYVKKGYFQAELTYTIVPVPDTNEIDIQVTVCEGMSGKIKSIEFEGLTSKEERELLELMITKRYNFVLSKIMNRGSYHPDMIEHDKMNLINYFQNKGFADAQVDIIVKPTEKQDRIILIIKVEKGRQYRIGTISIEGNTLFDTTCIEQALTFGSNYAYSPEGLRLSVQAITDLYGAKGYIDTNVDMAVTLRENNSATYDVTVIVDETEAYYVGLVKIFGNTYTQNSVILHESLLCPGELFDIRKLEGTERRINNTGLFAGVNVYAVESQLNHDGCGPYRDVYIEVEETDTGNLGLFGGFSSIDRIFGGVEITERNFNILGIPYVFQEGGRVLRGGGEYLNLKANIGDRQTSYTAQWTKPYFLDTPWIFGIELEKSNNRALSRGYELKTYGGNTHGTYIWNNYLKYDIYYRARHTYAVIRDSNNLFLEQEGSNAGFISGVGVALIYDSTDSPRRPTCGLRSRALYELAGLGGNFQFMKWSYVNSLYYPMNRRGTLKFRADCNFIHTWKTTHPTDLPLSERLFMGGDTTVRGYRPYIIGPKFGNNEPRGGVSSYLLSEEYQHNLLRAPCLDGFIFVDAGYLSLSEFTIGRFAASAGFGIRVEIMRGMPMTFGLGWPIHPTERVNGVEVDNSQRFFFSMGGNF